MLEKETIKELLSRTDIPPRIKVLLCMLDDNGASKKISEIKLFATDLGLQAIKKWNVSDYLSKSKGLCIRTSDGWELTTLGKNEIFKIIGPQLPSVTTLVTSSLRKQTSLIKNDDSKDFVDEAIKALEVKLYRSAIVLSWVGAVSVLYDWTIKNKLNEFNQEAIKRDAKWKAAKNSDDLCKIKEYDFLQILVAISAIGKNVKDELEVCLKLRNGCGHPNSLKIGEHKASAHIETLIQNIFSKFT